MGTTTTGAMMQLKDATTMMKANRKSMSTTTVRFGQRITETSSTTKTSKDLIADSQHEIIYFE